MPADTKSPNSKSDGTLPNELGEYSLLAAFMAARDLLARTEPVDAPVFYLNPFEWDHWALNGWFTYRGGKVLSNCPYEPAGYECLLLRLIPL